LRRNPSEISPPKDVVTNQPEPNPENIFPNKKSPSTLQSKFKSLEMSQKDFNLAIQAVGEVTQTVNKNSQKRNLFTDGLDLNSTTDWASELRPSMKKLRTAMDGLLKTARLMHR
jgi:hypothetical protein